MQVEASLTTATGFGFVLCVSSRRHLRGMRRALHQCPEHRDSESSLLQAPTAGKEGKQVRAPGPGYPPHSRTCKAPLSCSELGSETHATAAPLPGTQDPWLGGSRRRGQGQQVRQQRLEPAARALPAPVPRLDFSFLITTVIGPSDLIPALDII